MSGAVLIPVKAFDQAKARLSTHLSPTQRRCLARSLASAVIEAIRDHDDGLAIHIACDDDEVAEWARNSGAQVLWGPGLGLNGAIDTGIASLAASGVARVAVVHADLTRPERLGVLLDGHLVSPPVPPPPEHTRPIPTPSVVLVPDQHRDGTNIIIQPTEFPVPASYGPGSFQRHLSLAMDRARSLSWSVTVRYDPLLGLDIDTVEDLSHPLATRWMNEVSDTASTATTDTAEIEHSTESTT